MIKKQMSMTIEIGRYQKIKKIAEQRKKTMTSLVEDWIDTLELKETSDDPQ